MHAGTSIPRRNITPNYGNALHSVQSGSYDKVLRPPPIAEKIDTKQLEQELLSTKVELMLSARNLVDRDVFSKSDPMCVVYQTARIAKRNWESRDDRFVEIGRIGPILNCLNPVWNDKIRLSYHFEAKQPLRFEIYDKDSKSSSLDMHDYLGHCECLLADVVAAPNSTLTLPLKGVSSKKSEFTITAEELDEGQKESLYFVCHGRRLDRKDFFGKSDPFLEFYRLFLDGSRQMIHRTEVIKKSLNPEWMPIELTTQILCKGNKDSQFLIECYDYDDDGGHDLIGSCTLTINQLVVQSQRDFTLINEKKKRKKGEKYKGSGVLHFQDVKLSREHTFLEFISAGLQLEFAVAIDFTASNGAIHKYSSLHFVDSTRPNQYEMAICAVLEICERYNYSKRFQVTGFGARIPPHNKVSHLFPLEHSVYGNNRNVDGVMGVLSAYRNALQTVQLFGPTNFAPTINDYVCKMREFAGNPSRYQILLIITDGIITDMEATKSAIITASECPMSIIIVGVGGEDFEKMETLDADDQVLEKNGRKAKRDIVQFVPFRKFMGSHLEGAHDYAYLQSLLAKEVLAEVPGQVTSYMKANCIEPRRCHPAADGAGGLSPPSAAAQLPWAMHTNPTGYSGRVSSEFYQQRNSFSSHVGNLRNTSLSGCPPPKEVSNSQLYMAEATICLNSTPTMATASDTRQNFAWNATADSSWSARMGDGSPFQKSSAPPMDA